MGIKTGDGIMEPPFCKAGESLSGRLPWTNEVEVPGGPTCGLDISRWGLCSSKSSWYVRYSEASSRSSPILSRSTCGNTWGLTCSSCG